MIAEVTVDKFELWINLSQMVNLIAKYEQKRFSNTGITNQQFKVLWTIELITELDQKPAILTDLALLQNTSLASISLIVDRMEKKGLIKKARDLSDRRAIRLIITPKGEELLKKTIRPSVELINELFSIYSDEELQTTNLMAEKLTDRLEELNTGKPRAAKGKFTIQQNVNLVNKLIGSE